MAQFDDSQFYICGKNHNIINYKGKLFSILYPKDQIEEDIINNCLNCEYYGSWNGCQIMRCINCDKYGCGAVDKGIELNSNIENSVNNTYLKDIDWSQIGDTDIEDSKSLFINKENIFLEIIREKKYIVNTINFPYTCVQLKFYDITDEEEEEEEEDEEDEEEEEDDEEEEDEEKEEDEEEEEEYNEEAYEEEMQNKINIFLNEKLWFTENMDDSDSDSDTTYSSLPELIDMN
jgi:hypothetical protein